MIALPPTIAEEWEKFDTVLLQGASAVQKQEMRRAFYAGYQSAVTACSDLGDDAIPEDAGVAFLQARMDELAGFGKAIMAGKA